MDKNIVYSRAGEQLIECIILYYDSTANYMYACWDPECTKRLTAAELEHAFLTRCVLKDKTHGGLVCPQFFAKSSDGAWFQIFAGDTLISINSVEINRG